MIANYIIALLCVLALSAGQILFKISANSLTKSHTILSREFLTSLSVALIIYGIATLAWIWVLQKLDLGRAYPLMAIAFALVPIGSHFFFGEKFNNQYYLGVSLIIAGVVITTRSA